MGPDAKVHDTNTFSKPTGTACSVYNTVPALGQTLKKIA